MFIANNVGTNKWDIYLFIPDHFTNSLISWDTDGSFTYSLVETGSLTAPFTPNGTTVIGSIN